MNCSSISFRRFACARITLDCQSRMPVPTDINAMIRTKQSVKRVLMSTREISAIIRAALTDDDSPSTGLSTSSMAEPYQKVRPHDTSQKVEPYQTKTIA